jgi:large subunit ribosomal protein L13
MKTYSPKPEHIERRWYVVDASGQVLGRLASEVATILRGKHKPMYAPHMDTGDHVIIINADKIELTGNKGEDKYAYRHSGYPGGIKAVRYKDLMATRPIAAVEKAVRGMLPKNSLGRQMLKKLHVVPGGEHAHAAQKPIALTIGERPAWDGLPAPAPVVAAKPKKKSTKAEPNDAEQSEQSDDTKPKASSAKRKVAKPKAASAKPTSAKASAAKATSDKPKRTSAKAKKAEPKASADTNTNETEE